MKNNLAREIVGAVESVTKVWTRQRKREERHDNARMQREDALTRRRKVSVKEAAWRVMEAAYRHASTDGKYPAKARQVMYAARPLVLELTEGKCWKNSNYFTQNLLPDFMDEYPDLTTDWNVVFDARGNFVEPHTGVKIPLGTLNVEKYLADIERHTVKDLDVVISASFPTSGPEHRYGAILLIEKEGFDELFRAVNLAGRFDIGVISNKGLSVTATRHLAEYLCSRHGIPLLVLHDFDKAGFSIVGTMQRDTRRYQFTHEFEVIDLGLRLEDVRKYNLQSEPVHYGEPKFGGAKNPGENLRVNGATEEEIAYLVSRGREWSGYSGQRVELNAFASKDMIEWIEGKLTKHGIRKLIPDANTLDIAYRRACQSKRITEAIEKIRSEASAAVAKIKTPQGLANDVRARLQKNPTLSWDQAIVEVALEAQ